MIWGIVAFAAVLFLFNAFQKRRRLPYPPGPKGWPVIRNVLDVPRSQPWYAFTEWTKTYDSPLVYANALGTHILVVNEMEDAIELLERRAANYSDRPRFPLMELMGWMFNTGLIPYGDVWRLHRKLIQQCFRKDVMKRHHSVILSKTREMLEKLANTPEKFTQHCHIFASATVLSLVYGYELASPDDSLFKSTIHAIDEALLALSPAKFAVNTFPILLNIPRWFPGGGFHDWAAACKEITLKMRGDLYDYAKESIEKGEDRPTFVRDILERYGEKTANMGKEGLEFEDILSAASATFFSAGVDTTSATMQMAILMLATHPEVQQKAQAEIRQVLGNGQLPTLADRSSLPYTEAVFRELLRWRPTGPMGSPHAVREDDVYKGYFIPRGTLVITNIWAMTRNETLFPEPEIFRPERFLNPDGTISTNTSAFTFGFGRRICAGRYLASDTVWLGLAQILAMFTISNAVEVSTGKDITPLSVRYTDDVIPHPRPYRCSIQLNDGAERLVASGN
ncbi:cytochrome P450 [Pluteus cervinus]|uniref:Cytochrome P450 n=1 Tax=Pluteus cervinus TaxID=181527 RepID=A0ACD3B8J2_9AGAR|nr:cytochrome P450 [Pluteus cervinus]